MCLFLGNRGDTFPSKYFRGALLAFDGESSRQCSVILLILLKILVDLVVESLYKVLAFLHLFIIPGNDIYEF